MINVVVNEFKIGIKGTEYTFRLDFRALKNFNNRYENAMQIFNEFLAGKNIYDCIVKILSCSCVEKEFTEAELESNLSFDFKTMKLMDEITFALVEGILSEEKEKTKGNKKAKN
jgi:hypothetical protein